MCSNSKSRTKDANTELSFTNLQKMMAMCSQQTYLVNLLKRYSPNAILAGKTCNTYVTYRQGMLTDCEKCYHVSIRNGD